MSRVLLIGYGMDEICHGNAIYTGTAQISYNLLWFYEGLQHSCRENCPACIKTKDSVLLQVCINFFSALFSVSFVGSLEYSYHVFICSISFMNMRSSCAYLSISSEVAPYHKKKENPRPFYSAVTIFYNIKSWRDIFKRNSNF